MWDLMTLDGFVEGPNRDISFHLDVWGEELERLSIEQGRSAGDVVAQTVGEETALLLPDTGPAGAFQPALCPCDALREHDFPPATPGGKPINLTTSICVVSGAPEMDDDFASLFSARADVALYAAKRSGRDRVRAWSDDLSAGEDTHPFQIQVMAETGAHRAAR